MEINLKELSNSCSGLVLLKCKFKLGLVLKCSLFSSLGTVLSKTMVLVRFILELFGCFPIVKNNCSLKAARQSNVCSFNNWDAFAHTQQNTKKQQCNLLINTKTYVQYFESCFQQNKSQESLHNDQHQMQDFWRLEATA